MIKDPVNHILKNDGASLGALLNHAQVLQRMNTLFTQYLDDSLAKHCQIAKYEQQRLIVMTDSGAWTTRLQYKIPELLESLRQHPEFQDIKAICCKTYPENISARLREQKPVRSVQPISKDSALAMIKIAENTKDEKIRNILKKFAEKFL
ncbi:hypothetical protein AYO45_02860 [Gammaproteobacteria bacterium SCGC AG-212-F23]|nr:hypothetical protein AYO45_02860 [Gammaproteobacteria bacterium SCGC AG-212-F23]